MNTWHPEFTCLLPCQEGTVTSRMTPLLDCNARIRHTRNALKGREMTFQFP